MKRFAQLLTALILTAFAAPALQTTALCQSTLSGKRIQPATLPAAALSATGSPSSTTYLRGDWSWATPPGGASDHKAALNSSDASPSYLDAKLGVSGILTIGDVSGVRTVGLPAAGAGTSGYLLGSDWALFSGKEPALGNPATSGYVLSSTAAGARSWIAPASGPAGPQGPAGPTGAAGAQGPAGSAGATGAAGTNGAAATVAVGTTTTLAAGAAATVTNSGTSAAAVLNFGIPAGAAGTDGGGGISVVSSLPTPSTTTDNNYYLLRQGGKIDALYVGTHNGAGSSRLAQIPLTFTLSKLDPPGYSAGLARWLCEETGGATLADSIGTSNLTASAANQTARDAVGNAFLPAGTHYANGAAGTGLLTGQGDFSVEDYIQTGATVNSWYASQSDLTGSNGGIIFECGASSTWVGYIGTAAGGGAYYRLGVPAANTLYHVVLVYTAANTTATLYVNGASLGTQNIGGARAIPTSSTVNRLGDRAIPTSTTSYRFTGKIYFGAIYARALSAGEVQARYNAIN